MGARRARHRSAGRPHPDHPRQRTRHAAHARGQRRAGDAGGVPFLKARGADRGRRHHGSIIARRHLRGDVGGRLLDQQSVADGAGGQRRLRGRRCYRDDRERVPQSGAGLFSAARDAQRRPPDRLHRGVDQRLAHGRFHPAAVHGWHRRPLFPRILGDVGVRDRCLHSGVVVGDADDLRLFRAGGAEPRRHLARPLHGGLGLAHGALLRP